MWTWKSWLALPQHATHLPWHASGNVKILSPELAARCGVEAFVAGAAAFGAVCRLRVPFGPSCGPQQVAGQELTR